MMEWEIDVEVRVRKTLVVAGPPTGEAAQQMVLAAIEGGMEMATFQKWAGGYPPRPVEQIIGNEPPTVVAVRAAVDTAEG